MLNRTGRHREEMAELIIDHSLPRPPTYMKGGGNKGKCADLGPAGVRHNPGLMQGRREKERNPGGGLHPAVLQFSNSHITGNVPGAE